ncbi:MULTISPECIES: 16S rRNA (cytosine(967)-C(5))-methyltransferase [unclassified Thermosipho (in: thermotogales)]|uniref:16S rRNA (cytosine(967)-C(5))-methyltransferase n=1 Tax=unclassified Thermosipho (in: thermotogales) TaxID=2676525 RepID=UPI0009863163|nr:MULTISPECIES: 16S rRNA (cytosine(967)-C(5))-methyltransferase [unclassified Thermosipho (in: thermotogales)]MBT1247386.1 antitermination protein NusB [Thermosipho sp. 1244]OOC46361.1 antitermination protein NusB [Thermosipho sp. 1223]
MKSDLIIAYRLLRKKFKSGIFSTEFYSAFSYVEEKAFFKNLIFGVLRYQDYLDWVINSFLKNKEIPPSIRTILRMGTFQILFTNKPNYLIVNEMVDLVEKKSFKGLVNAVLRKISKIGYIEPKEIHLKFSHPKWLVEYWKSFLPTDYIIKMLELNQKPIKTTARVNIRKIERDNIKISNSSFTTHSPVGIVFEKIETNPWEFEEYKKGLITYQSESSQIIPLLVDFKKDEYVLDACAAPGGKATHILELQDVNLYVNDIEKERIKITEEQFKRLNLKPKKILNCDAQKIKLNDFFDKIFVDVPCSSLGTARRNPEVLRRQSKENFQKLSKIQQKIISNLWKNLKKHGLMVYSTCTVTIEENKNTVNQLKSLGEFLDIRNQLEQFGIKYIWDGYGALFYPDETLTPFYVSIIRKIKE